MKAYQYFLWRYAVAMQSAHGDDIMSKANKVLSSVWTIRITEVVCPVTGKPFDDPVQLMDGPVRLTVQTSESAVIQLTATFILRASLVEGIQIDQWEQSPQFGGRLWQNAVHQALHTTLLEKPRT